MRDLYIYRLVQEMTTSKESKEAAAARRNAVLQAHEAGATYKSIAADMGISADRVKQLIARARAERKIEQRMRE